MIVAYWELCNDRNDGLPCSQRDFIDLIASRMPNWNELTQTERDNFYHRVGFVAYPAFVRQHHFGLMLRDRFGGENVLGGPIADEHYKTDWVVIDSDERPHAIHLSTFRNPTTSSSLLNVYANHSMKHSFSGERIGKGTGFFLHSMEEIPKINCEELQPIF